MDNSYYFDLFNDYLVNVKKASSNTLSSYLRDIRRYSPRTVTLYEKALKDFEQFCHSGRSEESRARF